LKSHIPLSVPGNLDSPALYFFSIHSRERKLRQDLERLKQSLSKPGRKP
jgi:hypothetical protein